MSHLIRVVALLLMLAAPVWAQSPEKRGTLSSTGVVTLDVRGMGTGAITVSGTYTGTVSFEVIGEPGTPAVTVDCATPAAPGTAVNSTTSTGVWTCPVAALSVLQARMSSYTNGTAIIYLSAAPGGGGSGGGGSGGGTFDGVLLDGAGGDPVTDTTNDAIRVNVVAGGGGAGTSMVDDAAFTPATTSITPAGALFDDVTPDSVNEGDGGALRMSANRNLYVTLRDAAGNERGLNIDASNRIAAVVSATDLDVQSGGADILSTTAFNAAFGTAGTADTQVVSVQGIASMTPVQVSDAGGSLTVDNGGTFAVQAAQSGTWNITNVSGTVSLPTGAATSANQSTEITALQLIDNLPNTIGSTTSGQSGALSMGAVTTSAPTYTTAQTHPLSLDTTGALRVAIMSGAGSGGTALADDADFTAGTTSFTPAGGFYQSSVTACTDGDTCAVGITAQRALKATLFTAAGAEITAATDVTEDAAETAGGTGPMVLSVRRDTAASSAGTSGDNATFNTDANGYLWTRQIDPCTALARTTLPISHAADTAIISASASNRTYICGGVLVASAAEVVNLWEGTGTACGTSSAALLGSTTEANGASLAANGGFIIPNTLRGLSTNVDVCIRLSATNRISGYLTYVQAP